LFLFLKKKGFKGYLHTFCEQFETPQVVQIVSVFTCVKITVLTVREQLFSRKIKKKEFFFIKMKKNNFNKKGIK